MLHTYLVSNRILMASGYNCMICFYYLAIITYKKKDDFVKGKLESWFHGFPMILTIAIGITGLIMKQFNNSRLGGNCYIVAN